jgi:hypothetical protein
VVEAKEDQSRESSAKEVKNKMATHENVKAKKVR